MFWIRLDIQLRYLAGEARQVLKQYLILLFVSAALADCERAAAIVLKRVLSQLLIPRRSWSW